MFVVFMYPMSVIFMVTIHTNSFKDFITNLDFITFHNPVDSEVIIIYPDPVV